MDARYYIYLILLSSSSARDRLHHLLTQSTHFFKKILLLIISWMQEIVDQDLSITTTFLKSWEFGSGYGGDWVVRIQAKKQGSSSSSSSYSEIQYRF
jgi:hypothetical protein